MLAIRTIEYDSEEPLEKIFSRLTWEVEKESSLVWPLLNGRTRSTSKSWVGVLNEPGFNFQLIEPRGFFTFRLFQILVTGKISTTNEGTSIVVNIKLGWHTFLFFVIMYLLSALILASLIGHWNTDNILAELLWLLVFPGAGTLLLYRKINAVEKKFEKTIGEIV